MADQSVKIKGTSGGVEIRGLAGNNYYFLEPGWKPGAGAVTVSSQEKDALSKLRSDSVTLEIVDYEGRKVEIKDLYVASFVPINDGTRYELRLEDGRCKWEFQTLTGHWNCLSEDGKTWLNKSLKNGTQKYSLKDFVDDGIKALTRETESGAGEASYEGSGDVEDVEGSDPESPTLRNVVWLFGNAGRAVHGALKKAGGFISRNFEAKIVACTGKSDAVYSKVKGLMKEATKLSGVATQIEHMKPKFVRVAFRTLREKEFTNSYFEPCLQHDGKDANGETLDDGEPINGEWAPADDVLSDWGLSEDIVRKYYTEPDMQGLRKKMSCGDDLRDSRLKVIKAQFYTHFRFKGPLTTSEESRDQILPLQPYLASTTSDDGTRVAALAGECHWHSKSKKDSSGTYVERNCVPPFPVRIVDAKMGIIAFRSEWPVCKIQQAKGGGKVYEDFELLEPSIKVTLAFLKKAQTDDWRDDFWFPNESGYTDSITSLGDNGKTKTVVADEYLIEVWDGGDYEKKNEEELTQYAQKYADDYYRKLAARSHSDEPTEMTVPGVRPEIDRLDAHVQSIKVEFGPKGTFTTFRFNDDLPLDPFTLNFPTDKPELSGTGETVKFAEGKGGGSGLHTQLDPGGLYQVHANTSRESPAPITHDESVYINPRTIGVSIAEGTAKSAASASGSASGAASHSGSSLGDFLHTIFNELGISAWAYQAGFFTAGANLSTVISAMASPDGGTASMTIGQYLNKMPESYRRRAQQAGFLSSSGSSGGGTVTPPSEHDPRSMFGRCLGESGNGGLDVSLIAKHDKYYEENLSHWVSKLVSSKLEPAQAAAAAPSPQITAALPIMQPGKTYSLPAPTPTPTTGTASGSQNPTGDQSTRVWDQSVEYPDTAKYGRFNQLFYINENHKYGEDQDKNQFVRLELNKNVMHWYKDKERHGPVADYGDSRPPVRQGMKQKADLIYDRERDVWDWIAWMNCGCYPPGPPEPTPVPNPTPGEPPPIPVPTPGDPGGGFPPGGGDPGGDPGGWPPGGGDGGSGPVPGPWGGIPGTNWPLPPLSPPEGTIEIGGPRLTPIEHLPANWWEGRTEEWQPSYGGDDLRVTFNQLPPNVFPGWWPNCAGFSSAPLWRIPGTQINQRGIENAYPVRPLGRTPGSMSIDDLLQFQQELIDPGDLEWGEDEADEQVFTHEDYREGTIDTILQDMIVCTNALISRTNALDARSRANYPTANGATMLDGQNSLSFTTPLAYTRQPCITMTPYGPLGQLSISSVTPNADGTYTFVVASEAAAIGDVPVDINVKGSVDSSEPIDG